MLSFLRCLIVIILYTYRSRKEYCVSKIATFYVIVQRLHVTVYRSLDLIRLRKLKKKKKRKKEERLTRRSIRSRKKMERVEWNLFASCREIRITRRMHSFLFKKKRVLFPFAKIREI